MLYVPTLRQVHPLARPDPGPDPHGLRPLLGSLLALGHREFQLDSDATSLGRVPDKLAFLSNAQDSPELWPLPAPARHVSPWAGCVLLAGLGPYHVDSCGRGQAGTAVAVVNE